MEKDIQGITELASAFYGSATLFAALEINLFGNIASLGGSTEIGALAELTGHSPRGLEMLCDACAALGLLGKEEQTYYNTEAGRMALVPGAPADLTRAIAYNRDVYPLWGKLAEFVHTGEPVERPAIHMGDDPERTRRFALSMRGRAFAIGRSVVPLLNLPAATPEAPRRLLDLAGGPAAYAQLIANAYPNWHVTTLDLPAISNVAQELVAADHMEERINCIAGDYHTAEFEPNSFDAVTIFGALHQESPRDIIDICSRACAAAKPGAPIFILDMMTDRTHTAPQFSVLFGLNMGITTKNGWVFSSDEMCSYLAAAGWSDPTLTPLPPPMPHWLLRAQKNS